MDKGALLIEMIRLDMKEKNISHYVISEDSIAATTSGTISIGVKANEVVYVYHVGLTTATAGNLVISSGVNTVEYNNLMFKSVTSVDYSDIGNMISKHFSDITITDTGVGVNTFFVKYIKIKILSTKNQQQ